MAKKGSKPAKKKAEPAPKKVAAKKVVKKVENVEKTTATKLKRSAMLKTIFFILQVLINFGNYIFCFFKILIHEYVCCWCISCKITII